MLNAISSSLLSNSYDEVQIIFQQANRSELLVAIEIVSRIEQELIKQFNTLLRNYPNNRYDIIKISGYIEELSRYMRYLLKTKLSDDIREGKTWLLLYIERHELERQRAQQGLEGALQQLLNQTRPQISDEMQ